MDSIKIGLLLPSSTILPISKDFEKGFKEGLKQINDGTEVEIIKEFIGQGDIKLVEKACNKFFSYDDADVVTGILSLKAAYEVSEKFKNQKRPLIINDIGGHIPDIKLLNEYVFINSPQLWRHAWTMGHWGVKTFGKRGMFIAAVYDAGYGFSQMFYEGMKAADADCEWAFSVPPMPPPGELTNMDVIFPYLEQYQPDFIFIAFCGGETTLFLNEFIKRGYHKKIKITALPYLLEPFKPIDADITIYTSGMSNAGEQLVAAKAFYQLGLQSGLAIADAATASDNDEFKQKLAQKHTMFNVAYPVVADDKVTLIKNDIKAGETNFSSTEMDQWETYPLQVDRLQPLTVGVSSGWSNPYLCI